MTQRAVVFETNGDYRSVIDIVEWPEDRLDLNKRRLKKHLDRRFSGTFDVLIEQVDGPKPGEIYRRTVTV